MSALKKKERYIGSMAAVMRGDSRHPLMYNSGMSELSERVLAAQADEAVLTELIRDHRKFILANAYRTVGHFVTESDDEWSVALIAFHEAVKSFDAEKGDFHTFAALVIKRRMIDHLKAEGKHAAEITVAPEIMDGDVDDETGDTAMALTVRSKEAELSAEHGMEDIPGGNPVKDEIEAVQEILRGYGFSFYDLIECSPKADKTRMSCAKAVAVLLSDHTLVERMRSTKALPMKELAKRSRVQKKVLERHRRYIIAAAEILNGEYPLLAEYMNYIREALVT